LATPEYDGSLSSVMKLVIENLGFPSVLAGKPVALMGVGGGIGWGNQIAGAAAEHRFSHRRILFFLWQCPCQMYRKYRLVRPRARPRS